MPSVFVGWPPRVDDKSSRQHGHHEPTAPVLHCTEIGRLNWKPGRRKTKQKHKFPVPCVSPWSRRLLVRSHITDSSGTESGDYWWWGRLLSLDFYNTNSFNHHHPSIRQSVYLDCPVSHTSYGFGILFFPMKRGKFTRKEKQKVFPCKKVLLLCWAGQEGERLSGSFYYVYNSTRNWVLLIVSRTSESEQRRPGKVYFLLWGGHKKLLC